MQNIEDILNWCNKYFEYDKLNGGFKYKKVPHGLSSKLWLGKQVGNLHPKYGYQAVRVNGRIWREHIIVFIFHHKRFPIDEIDHINRIYNDNRIENLRESDRSSNCSNRKGWSKHSKYKGVSPNKRGKPWEARITINKSRISLGTFMTEEEAAKAYDIAALKHNSEFSKTNFPKESYNDI